MSPAAAQPVVELATASMGGEGFDFLHPHDYIHPDLDRGAFAACWRQQFFECGPSCVLVARDGGGRLVAHYGILPMPYGAGGNSVRAGFICQLFVDPAYRKTPLFFQLERRILSEYGAFGFDFLYGLITIKPVLKAHLALGYARGADWHIHAFPLAPGAAMAGSRHEKPGVLRPALDAVTRRLARSALWLRRPAGKGVEVCEVEDHSRLNWGFVDRVQAGWPFHAERGPETFARRFAPFGSKRYRVFAAASGGAPRGYLVLRRTQVGRFDVAAIIDVIAAPGDVAAWNALLAHACRFGLESGCDAVAALACPGTPDAEHLASNLFFRTGSHFTLVHAMPDELRASAAGGWHLSWFDHDYI